jgi:hypothetical protein
MICCLSFRIHLVTAWVGCASLWKTLLFLSSQMCASMWNCLCVEILSITSRNWGAAGGLYHSCTEAAADGVSHWRLSVLRSSCHTCFEMPANTTRHEGQCSWVSSDYGVLLLAFILPHPKILWQWPISASAQPYQKKLRHNFRRALKIQWWGRSSESIWKTAMELSAVPVKMRLSTTFQQSRFPSGDTVGYLVN